VLTGYTLGAVKSIIHFWPFRSTSIHIIGAIWLPHKD
jgi:hypothetical protein